MRIAGTLRTGGSSNLQTMSVSAGQSGEAFEFANLFDPVRDRVGQLALPELLR